MTRTLYFFWETLKRTTQKQIYHRAVKVVRRRVQPLGRWHRKAAERRAVMVLSKPCPILPETADGLLGDVLIRYRVPPIAYQRMHRLLSTAQSRGGTLNWVKLPGDAYQQYYDHGFPFAPDLASSDDPELLLKIAHEWLEQCPPGTNVAWDPHPMARRITNWIIALEILRVRGIHNEIMQAMTLSLRVQLCLLESQLEFDLLGNHLTTEARALVLGGAFFRQCPQGKAWYRKGKAVLEQEAPSQILADGWHYERSPMYHFVVLMDYLEASQVLGRLGEPFEQPILDLICRMARCGRHILAPNGLFPLLNDATYDYLEVEPDVTLGAAAVIFAKPDLCSGRSLPTHPIHVWLTGGNGTMSFKGEIPAELQHGGEAGYHVVRENWGETADFLVFDTGSLGPEENPGHGHADTLQVIWHHQGMPILVDPGVATYHDVSKRNYYRGTFAHNTPLVNQQDSADLWDRFRFGRTNCGHLQMNDVLQTPWGPAYYLVGVHDGFERLPQAATVMRSVLFVPGVGIALRDQVNGNGAMEITCPFHFHPEVAISEPTPGRLRIRGRGDMVLHGATTAFETSVTLAPYAERYGEPQESAVWLVGGRTQRSWEAHSTIWNPTKCDEQQFREWMQGVWM